MIPCITFDADGTLLDFEGTMRAALAHSLADIRSVVPGAPADALTVDRLIAIRGEAADDARGSVRTMEELRLLAFQRTLERLGCPDPALAEWLTARYLERRFHGARLFPDVLPTLDALAGRYRLGLASNGNSYPERCGLAGRFDFAILSQEIGVSKPDPRFYRTVADAACVPLRQIVHVGDSLTNDVFGAQAAGFRTVWLNRGGLVNETGIRADAEIGSLSNLMDAITTTVAGDD